MKRGKKKIESFEPNCTLKLFIQFENYDGFLCSGFSNGFEGSSIIECCLN